MRTAWLSLLTLILLAGSLMARDRITLDVSLHDSSKTLSGKVAVTWYGVDSSFSNPHFRLWGNRVCQEMDKEIPDSCGMLIHAVEVNGVSLGTDPVIDGTDLAIPLMITEPSDSLTLTLLFETRVPETAGRFGYFEGNYLLDGWFPMPAPHRNGTWLVIPYDDESELVGDFFDFQVFVNYPDSMQLIAPGRVGSDTTDHKIRDQFLLSPAHDFAMLIGREFKLKSYASENTTVNIYYQTNEDESIDSTARSVIFTLDWMAEHVGPYPFPELVIVETGIGISGGVEFPQMFWQSDVSSGAYSRFLRSVAIHETLHQWFYGILASNQAEEPWLDESITQYFTELINDAEMGGEPHNVRFFGFVASAHSENRLRGYSHLDAMPITRSAVGYTREDYFPVIYGKGPMVIKTIAGLLGDSAQPFWQEYYRRFLFGYPTESDFVALLNQYPPFAERQNAQQFIRIAGAVDYRVEKIESEAVPDSNQYRSKVTLTAIHPLPFPVRLRLAFPTEPYFDTLIIPSPGQQLFTVTRAEPVMSAQFDPNGSVAIDSDYLNNSYARNGHGAAFRLFSGITFLVESFISLVWGM
ncbi:MAG: hypothetical protein IPH75_04620 [bacterium]|nr:hypothetical protein [bacterium]